VQNWSSGPPERGASPGAAPGAPGPAGFRCGFGRFLAALGHLAEVPPHRIGRQVEQGGGAFLHRAAERLVVQQGGEQVARADLRTAGFKAGEQPGLAQPGDDVGRERRRARIAGLEAVERAGDLVRDAPGIDAALAHHGRDVGARGLDELEQHMLDLDVVVSAGEGQPGRGFQLPARERVHAPDEGFEVDRHHLGRTPAL
jgi:hypothetical protein